MLDQTGGTQNNYLFTGEQYDSSLDQYYLRARYYDPGAGRFTQMDTYQGRMGEPVTLHKYLYGNGNPVSNIDPTGQFSLMETGVANNIAAEIGISGHPWYLWYLILKSQKVFLIPISKAGQSWITDLKKHYLDF